LKYHPENPEDKQKNSRLLAGGRKHNKQTIQVGAARESSMMTDSAGYAQV